MHDFADRTALITGGGRGIGLAAATRLAEAGGNVVTFDLEAHAPPTCLALAGDVATSRDLTDAVDRVLQAHGGLDVLVCAAGVMGSAVATEDVSDELWNRVLTINARGTFAAIRAVLPHMVERGYGRIVTIASIAGKEGQHRGDAYAASKAAVISLTRTIGRDIAGTGVLINCVVPALIETDMAEALSPDQYEIAVSRIPLGRLGRPAEVAALIAFLASDELTFSTGACFDITGGRGNY